MSDHFKMLCSYAYFRKKDMSGLVGQVEEAGTRPVMVFGDSGAHSARTLGITLDLDEYAAWCQQWDEQLTLYSNLDVIGAPQKTWDHQRRLEEEYGLQPIPVFHTGEDWKWLERYLEDGYTYIALGKLLGNPLKTLMPWLAKAFRIAGDTAVFHGFGMTTMEPLFRFPFYSVDSSTWGESVRYGRMRIFDGRRHVYFDLRDKAGVVRHRHVIRSYGADPMVFASRASYDRPTVAGVAAASWDRIQHHVRDTIGPVTLPPGPHDPVRRRPGLTAPDGLNLYLADTWSSNLLAAAQGIHRARTHQEATCSGP